MYMNMGLPDGVEYRMRAIIEIECGLGNREMYPDRYRRRQES